MSKTPDLEKIKADLEASVSQRLLSTHELKDFKRVTNGLMQDALNVWDELWAELDGRDSPNGITKLESGFEPSCGWTEFLQKMWVLRHYLNFTKRYSRQ
jgi:hypothetical protein